MRPPKYQTTDMTNFGIQIVLTGPDTSGQQRTTTDDMQRVISTSAK